jgi:hypothetical protein
LKDGFDDGRKALAYAANWMRSFRVGSSRFGSPTDEGRNDHDVADPEKHPPHEARLYRHALGIPLAQRFSRGQDGTITVQSKFHDGNNWNDRYPSPLRFKVVRLGRGTKLGLLVVLLRDLLLDEGTQVRLSAKGRYTDRTARLSHDLLDRMMADGDFVH